MQSFKHVSFNAGKTMENIRRRKNFNLRNTPRGVTTLASRAEFLRSVIFNEELVGILLAQSEIKMLKPIYIGAAVLDHSKLEMYQLRYEHMARYEREFDGTIRIAGKWKGSSMS